MSEIEDKDLDWDKGNGLLPAIVQDEDTREVLMLGYMNAQALAATKESGHVTFYSRSKGRLWTKGETSGNVLSVISLKADCDRDTILVRARPAGPVCHKGTDTCFGEENRRDALLFLKDLSRLIGQRRAAMPEGSYTTSLFAEGTDRIAQKVGEEGVELALAHSKGDQDKTRSEAADLVFHLLVLLEDAGLTLEDVCALLQERH